MVGPVLQPTDEATDEGWQRGSVDGDLFSVRPRNRTTTTLTIRKVVMERGEMQDSYSVSLLDIGGYASTAGGDNHRHPPRPLLSLDIRRPYHDMKPDRTQYAV